MTIKSLLSLGAVMMWVVVGVGCGGAAKSRPYDDGARLTFSDADTKEINKEIEALKRGKQVKDIEGMAIYSEAVVALTNRGSRIEAHLLETLAGHDDWSVRRGIVEVLASTGTRRSIEHLITATGDPVPLVALYAEKTLEAMTDFKPIPGAGEPTNTYGLTPVPQRAPTNLELDAEEKLWGQWHTQNGRLLHATWQAWWKEHRGTAVIK